MENFINIVIDNKGINENRDIIVDSVLSTANIGLMEDSFEYEMFESESNKQVLSIPIKKSLSEKQQKIVAKRIAHKLFDKGYSNFDIEFNLSEQQLNENLLRQGSRGPEVKALQQQLGMPPAEQDGIFGPKTEQAVRNFQTNQGLQVDGIVGPQTRASIANSQAAGVANRDTPYNPQEVPLTPTQQRAKQGAPATSPRPKARPDGTPTNTMAPPPTGPGGDQPLPTTKQPAQAPVTEPGGAPLGDPLKGKELPTGPGGDQALPKAKAQTPATEPGGAPLGDPLKGGELPSGPGGDQPLPTQKQAPAAKPEKEFMIMPNGKRGNFNIDRKKPYVDNTENGVVVRTYGSQEQLQTMFPQGTIQGQQPNVNTTAPEQPTTGTNTDVAPATDSGAVTVTTDQQANSIMQNPNASKAERDAAIEFYAQKRIGGGNDTSTPRGTAIAGEPENTTAPTLSAPQGGGTAPNVDTTNPTPPNVDTDAGANAQAGLGQNDTSGGTSGFQGGSAEEPVNVNTTAPQLGTPGEPQSVVDFSGASTPADVIKTTNDAINSARQENDTDKIATIAQAGVANLPNVGTPAEQAELAKEIVGNLTPAELSNPAVKTAVADAQAVINKVEAGPEQALRQYVKDKYDSVIPARFAAQATEDQYFEAMMRAAQDQGFMSDFDVGEADKIIQDELRKIRMGQTESVTARPKGTFNFKERAEWEQKYGKTHNKDGSLKPRTFIKESKMQEVTFHDDNEFFEAYGVLWFNEDEMVDEAEYQGRKVKLGKPMAGDVKKFKVYVKNPKGNVVKVNFGQKGAKIKKSNPERRRSFRARHNCDNPGPRHKARYWSCRKW